MGGLRGGGGGSSFHFFGSNACLGQGMSATPPAHAVQTLSAWSTTAPGQGPLGPRLVHLPLLLRPSYCARRAGRGVGGQRQRRACGGRDVSAGMVGLKLWNCAWGWGGGGGVSMSTIHVMYRGADPLGHIISNPLFAMFPAKPNPPKISARKHFRDARAWPRTSLPATQGSPETPSPVLVLKNHASIPRQPPSISDCCWTGVGGLPSGIGCCQRFVPTAGRSRTPNAKHCGAGRQYRGGRSATAVGDRPTDFRSPWTVRMQPCTCLHSAGALDAIPKRTAYGRTALLRPHPSQTWHSCPRSQAQSGGVGPD